MKGISRLCYLVIMMINHAIKFHKTAHNIWTDPNFTHEIRAFWLDEWDFQIQL
jgi:hypothetical protein